jgi:aryl-alcohol dehydrogenase-like predicted oxidoreductase
MILEVTVKSVNNSGIQKRRLGKTELEVTPIGLGCWQFAGGSHKFFWKSPPQEEVNNIVKATLEGGVNWFDTAELYGKGRSERALATALCKTGMERDVIIATKWMPFMRTSGNIPRTIDTRLTCLAPCKIDLYQIHMPYAFSSVEAQMDAMAGLVKEGKVRYIGVSNFSAVQMRRAHAALAKHGLPLASNQVRFNLLNRNPEKNGVLKAAKELSVSLIAYSPLAQGLLTGKFHQNPAAVRSLPFYRRMTISHVIEKTRPLMKVLEEIAAAHNCTPSEVALSWAVNFHGDTIVAIPGATKLEHVRQNVGALALKLTQEEMVRLDEQSRIIS